MRRRKFIKLIGGAALAWPLAVRAQPERMRRVGVLEGVTESDVEPVANLAAFRQELEQFGWNDSRNLRFDVRFGLAWPNAFASTQQSWSPLHLMLY
jgi:putative ABC transport system substrate-binding protein